MKVTLEIDTNTDGLALAQLCRGLCRPDHLAAAGLTLADGGDLPASDVVATTTTKPRGRRAQTAAERTVEAFAAIQEQDKAAGHEPQATRSATARDLTAEEKAEVVADPDKVAADNSAAVAEVTAVADMPSEDSRTDDELLVAVREKASEEGALFIRGVMQKYDVKGLSKLSRAQMLEVLS